jgi:hypothetical protein
LEENFYKANTDTGGQTMKTISLSIDEGLNNALREWGKINGEKTVAESVQSIVFNFLSDEEYLEDEDLDEEEEEDEDEEE